MTKDFSLKKIVVADEFSCDGAQHSLIVHKGTSMDMANVLSECDISGTKLHMPMFFGKIHLQTRQFSLLEFVKYYAFDDTFLLLGVSNELWELFWERIFFYLQIVLLSVLPLLLFVLFERFNYIRWIAAFAPYPIYTVFTVLIRYFLHNNLYFYAMLALYGVVFIGLMFFYVKYYTGRRRYPLANF